MNESFYFLGRNAFYFNESGFFGLVNKRGEPLYEQALPFFQKACSHLVWIFFWIALILTCQMLFPTQRLTDRLFMILIFFHLFLFGCRLTSLLLTGGLRPILFPPLWVKLTRKLQKGEGIALLQKYHLENHPGLLSNLAITQYARGEYADAQKSITLALSYANNHPILLTLSEAINKKYPFL